MSGDRTIPTKAQGSVVTFTIKIDGKVIPGKIGVKSVDIYKEVNRVPTAKIVLIDGDASTEDFPVSNEALFVPGNEVEIFAGHNSEEDLLFKGLIIRHGVSVRKNGVSLLKLECKDICVKLTIGRNSNYYTEVKDSDAIEQILEKYGIASDIEQTEVSHKELVQFHALDWDFIVSRAEMNGKLCIPDNGVFRIVAPDLNQEPILTLIYGSTIIEVDVEMDARNQFHTVKSQSWDYFNQELLEAESEDPGFEESGDFSSSELADAVGLDAITQRHSGQVLEDELQTWADAMLMKSRLAKLRGRVTFEGFSGIKPGTTLELLGLGNRFNGKVYVSGVKHQLTDGSWLSHAQFGLSPDCFASKKQISPLDGSGLIPAIKGLQIGVVTQLEEDPDGEHRILVRSPLINADDEGAWCRVASLDAGDGSGFFFRPEIGSEVVMGYLNDDPRDAIVIGSLHSSAKPAPIDSSDDNFEKGYVSKFGLKFLLNDDKKNLSLETPGGNKMLLSEEDGGITLEDENGNKIVMSSEGINIESAGAINLKTSSGDINIEGLNISQKAQSQLKAEGGAGVELSSSAIAVLKGSLVQIN